MNNQSLRNGCILASIAHAIMVLDYPQLDYEQSWDGNNYSIQDGEGCRGTISFASSFCVGAFRNDKNPPISYSKYLENIPTNVKLLAESDALQYLLENLNNNVVPVVTHMFWGNETMVTIENNSDELDKLGLNLVLPLVMNYISAIEYWGNYYEMANEKITLLEELYKQKIINYDNKIVLTPNQIYLLGDTNNAVECKLSFAEIGIEF